MTNSRAFELVGSPMTKKEKRSSGGIFSAASQRLAHSWQSGKILSELTLTLFLKELKKLS